MDNCYSFAAIRGIQAGRAYYVAMIPLKTLDRLFQQTNEKPSPQHRAQRDLNKGRVPKIARYINDNPADYVLSALSASIDGRFEFEASEQRSVGILHVDMNAAILINDGQHRRAGIIEAVRERPSLGDETIAVTLFPDEGLTRSQQMFVDLNQHSVKPARSLRLFYNSRDPEAQLTRVVVDAVAVFRSMTDFNRSNLPGSSKLFAFSSVHSATAILATQVSRRPSAEQPELAIAFWQSVAANIPDWEAAARHEVEPADLRRDTVHAHGIALEAIAFAGARAIESEPNRWEERLQGLGAIDWSRSNADLWEGRALVNGRINRSRTSVLLTAELISRCLEHKSADAAELMH